MFGAKPGIPREASESLVDEEELQEIPKHKKGIISKVYLRLTRFFLLSLVGKLAYKSLRQKL